MNLAKRIILLTLFWGQTALAQNAYLINYGDDAWAVELITETCPWKLQKALDMVARKLSNADREIVAVLPEKVGYQFFQVEFKEYRDGEVVDLEIPVVYKFQYWTMYDRHRRCIKVKPYNIASR